jgi:uncharacterized protein (TIGR02117 family)
MMRLLLAAILLLSLPTAAGETQPAASTNCRAVYVADHGWHTGIAVRAVDFDPADKFLANKLQGAEWLEFGWGDAAFYQAEEPSFGIAFMALMTPTEAVMHVHGFDAPPSERYISSKVVRLWLNESGYARLLRRLRADFTLDTAGRVVPIKPGLYRQSHFYRAEGSYSLVRTCNNWTAEALAEGGVVIDPGDATRASDVVQQLKGLASKTCDPT